MFHKKDGLLCFVLLMVLFIQVAEKRWWYLQVFQKHHHLDILSPLTFCSQHSFFFLSHSFSSGLAGHDQSQCALVVVIVLYAATRLHGWFSGIATTLQYTFAQQQPTQAIQQSGDDYNDDNYYALRPCQCTRQNHARQCVSKRVARS